MSLPLLLVLGLLAWIAATLLGVRLWAVAALAVVAVVLINL